MRNKILRLIKSEDKKNPLTDVELAKILFINRSEVTKLRIMHGIPDSRERRHPILTREVARIVEKNPQYSERTITAELKKSGFNISRFSVSKLLKELNESERDEKVIRGQPEGSSGKKANGDPFTEIIGWNQSLSIKVEQAKAAVLYPPNGLHTLIVGATGVGKSQLAEAMYRFAVYAKSSGTGDFPYIVFNCADYAENPQLLLAQLFGYRKGAFTGAETDRDGLVAKADGGMLFLDEVHRLPHDGQEILFQLIDKGKYRRLGETSVVHEARIMIVAATSEDIEKSLLATFRRRIPMVIEIPSLSTRPVEERLEIIKMFFQKEAARISKKITVSPHVIKTLLVYECMGNVGQLRSDIQVACARGFLRYVAKNNNENCVLVEYEDLPVHVTKSMINMRWDRAEMEKIAIDDLAFMPYDLHVEESGDSVYIFPSDIYKNIEEEYLTLQKHGLSDDVINRIIGNDLEAKVRKIIRHVEKNKHNLVKQDLRSIVQPEIVDLVQEMIKVAKSSLGEIDDTLLYCLATHLNGSVKRIRGGKSITYPHLDEVKANYFREFKIATEMAGLAKSYLGFDLPEEEIGFIAMYVRTLANNKLDLQKNIGIVVLTHGNVAHGMADVANSLLGVEHVKAVEMSLDEKPEEAYKKAWEAVINSNLGKGVLLLVDMGSLAGFGNLITKATGIKTRTVSRVDTMMVIEALRKVLLPDAELDNIARSLGKTKGSHVYRPDEDNSGKPEETAIISICLTGEGTADYIREIIHKEIKEADRMIKVLTLGAIGNQDINTQIDRFAAGLKIIAIVGTINPYYPGIPYISAAEVLKGEGLAQIRRIIGKDASRQKYPQPGSVFHSDLVMLDCDVSDKRDAINKLGKLLQKGGFVTPNFIQGVLEREKIGSTALTNALAIPHGNSEDIIRPAVAVMSFKKPVDWDEYNKVSLVFLLALNENSADKFQNLYKIMKNEEIIKHIRQSRDKGRVLSILHDNLS